MSRGHLSLPLYDRQHLAHLTAAHQRIIVKADFRKGSVAPWQWLNRKALVLIPLQRGRGAAGVCRARHRASTQKPGREPDKERVGSFQAMFCVGSSISGCYRGGALSLSGS